MSAADLSGIHFRDAWVHTPHGRLFTRSWSPAGDAGDAEKLPPIVLFHDSLGCVELWRTFPEHLCERTGRRVIAYDRLGFGKSDPYRHEWTGNFIREESDIYFAAVREQLHFDDFVLFGHSVGGGMSVVCAGTFPESCRALITVSAQAFVEDRTLHGILSAREEFRNEGQVERLGKYHGTKARWVLGAWIETWLSPPFAAWSLQNDLPRVTCPVLAIHGSEDEYGSIRHPEMIGRLASGPSRVEILHGCHHMPHREEEQRVLDIVTGFLNDI